MLQHYFYLCLFWYINDVFLKHMKEAHLTGHWIKVYLTFSMLDPDWVTKSNRQPIAGRHNIFGENLKCYFWMARNTFKNRQDIWSANKCIFELCNTYVKIQNIFGKINTFKWRQKKEWPNQTCGGSVSDKHICGEYILTNWFWMLRYICQNKKYICLYSKEYVK